MIMYIAVYMQWFIPTLQTSTVNDWKLTCCNISVTLAFWYWFLAMILVLSYMSFPGPGDTQSSFYRTGKQNHSHIVQDKITVTSLKTRKPYLLIATFHITFIIQNTVSVHIIFLCPATHPSVTCTCGDITWLPRVHAMGALCIWGYISFIALCKGSYKLSLCKKW